jgi:hypothetical protein
MSLFTISQVEMFKEKASKEKHFANFIWYNQYLEVTYVIPQSEFKGFRVPQWSKIQSMVVFEDSFILKLAIFNDGNWLYSVEIALKFDLITFKK